MKVRVKGTLRDLWAFFRLIPQRKGRIRRAAASFLADDPVGGLARALHPERLDLTVASVKLETPTARTYRLVPAQAAAGRRLPAFRAGQYLSLHLRVGGSTVSRPYSISSSPQEAAEHDYYELTVRRKQGGFASLHIWERWGPGTAVRSSGPIGEFTYEPLRDEEQLVLLAGGCGITPFRSLLRDVLQHHPAVRCTLLYGVRRPDDVLFREDLETLQRAHPERLRVHVVCSEPEAGADPAWSGLTGLLSAGLIREQVGQLAGRSFFVSGPPEMYDYLEAEMRALRALGLPPGRVRCDVHGELHDVTLRPDFPTQPADKVFSVRVRGVGPEREVPARADETVLVALERAALSPPAACRSGQCGYCRSRLIGGEVYTLPETDGRRQADRVFGYFHPCSAYPLSDLEIEVPANPLLAEETTAAAPAPRGGEP